MDNIIMIDHQEIGCEVMNWVELAQDPVQVKSIELIQDCVQ
jgi:hypothetical protein